MTFLRFVVTLSACMTVAVLFTMGVVVLLFDIWGSDK